MPEIKRASDQESPETQIRLTKLYGGVGGVEKGERQPVIRLFESIVTANILSLRLLYHQHHHQQSLPPTLPFNHHYHQHHHQP